MQNKYLKVKDAEELVRDVSSSAILNTDNAALKAYKAKKAKEALVDQIIKENAELKTEISEIKSLLKQMIAGQK
jgi:hypothetical protein